MEQKELFGMYPPYLHELEVYTEFGEQIYKDEVLNNNKIEPISNQIEVLHL